LLNLLFLFYRVQKIIKEIKIKLAPNFVKKIIRERKNKPSMVVAAVKTPKEKTYIGIRKIRITVFFLKILRDDIDVEFD
jgi:hypothetical protein